MIRKTTQKTLSEYDYLIRKGVFDDIIGKVELIRGKVVEMNPACPVHDDYIVYLTNWSSDSRDRSRTQITSQTGVDLPEIESRPEPDVFWVRKARYRKQHPLAADVQLAIEVADSSLVKDLETKSKLYAEVGIAEYWIVDCQNRCVHVLREPCGQEYKSHRICYAPETISPLVSPHAILDLQDLFDGE